MPRDMEWIEEQKRLEKTAINPIVKDLIVKASGMSYTLNIKCLNQPSVPSMECIQKSPRPRKSYPAELLRMYKFCIWFEKQAPGDDGTNKSGQKSIDGCKNDKTMKSNDPLKRKSRFFDNNSNKDQLKRSSTDIGFKRPINRFESGTGLHHNKSSTVFENQRIRYAAQSKSVVLNRKNYDKLSKPQMSTTSTRGQVYVPELYNHRQIKSTQLNAPVESKMPKGCKSIVVNKSSAMKTSYGSQRRSENIEVKQKPTRPRVTDLPSLQNDCSFKEVKSMQRDALRFHPLLTQYKTLPFADDLDSPRQPKTNKVQPELSRYRSELPIRTKVHGACAEMLPIKYNRASMVIPSQSNSNAGQSKLSLDVGNKLFDHRSVQAKTSGFPSFDKKSKLPNSNQTDWLAYLHSSTDRTNFSARSKRMVADKTARHSQMFCGANS